MEMWTCFERSTGLRFPASLLCKGLMTGAGNSSFMRISCNPQSLSRVHQSHSVTVQAAKQSGCALLKSSSLLCCTISQVCLITSTIEGGCIGKQIHYYHCYSALVINLPWLKIHNPPCCCFLFALKGECFTTMTYMHDILKEKPE